MMKQAQQQKRCTRSTDRWRQGGFEELHGDVAAARWEWGADDVAM